MTEAKMDKLLEDRLVYSRALSRADGSNPMLIKAIKRDIEFTDREIKRTSCDIAAQPDIDAAFHALEKAKYSDDEEKAKQEYDFHMTSATYKFVQRHSGQSEADDYLSDKSKELGKDYIAHIRNGTIPDF